MLIDNPQPCTIKVEHMPHTWLKSHQQALCPGVPAEQVDVVDSDYKED